MLRAELDQRHWTLPDFKQRMTAKEWRQLLLDGQDKIIYLGRVTPLKAKNLGYGVVEVYKDIERQSAFDAAEKGEENNV